MKDLVKEVWAASKIPMRVLRGSETIVTRAHREFGAWEEDCQVAIASQTVRRLGRKGQVEKDNARISLSPPCTNLCCPYFSLIDLST